MTKIVGIRFRSAGKIYYFDPADFELEVPMHVIVETARGIEMGTVLIPPKDVEDDQVIMPLKPVIRVATDEDEKIVERNKAKEKEAFRICKEKILKHELEMKLVDAEYTFDGNKLLFYFTADGRIDFRELVKDLAAVFRTRIELRQIGVRDETKILGGIGICGRELCCKSYLSDFVPVSIKMAKEQNLSLNPTKISGVCGRLMCCLKNEQDTYEYLNSRLPNVGERITLNDGASGEVKSVSVLRQLVKVVVENGDEKELREYSIDDIRNNNRRRRDVRVTEEELAELRGLEDNDEALETEEKRHRRERNRRDNRENRDNRDNNDNQKESNRGNKDNYRDKNDNHDNKRDNRRNDNFKENRREFDKREDKISDTKDMQNDNTDNNQDRKGNITENSDNQKGSKDIRNDKNDNKKNFRNRRNRNRGKNNGNKQQSDSK